MKAWLLTLLLLTAGGLPGWRWLLRVRDHNQAQELGLSAAARGQAAEAAYYFGQAVALSGRGGPAPDLLLALAQAQAQAGQAGRARATYGQLLGQAVPPAFGSTARQQLAVLLARQGQPAQALGLLRQALRLNAGNLAARYDYEVLSRYLAARPTPPPPTAPAPDSPPPTPPKPRPDSAAGGAGKRPGGPAGSSGHGQQPTPSQPQSDGAKSSSAPDPSGRPNQPEPARRGQASGGRQPGSGTAQPMPTGAQPGAQRGLDQSGPAGTGAASGRPGTEAATDADAQLQTQRERLRAMNLSPAQAQQLLDALRASEQQYLQQQPHPRRGAAPAPGQPTW